VSAPTVWLGYAEDGGRISDNMLALTGKNIQECNSVWLKLDELMVVFVSSTPYI
jgi:hypothetical protein